MGFLQGGAGYVQDGQVGEAFVEKKVDESAVSTADVDDAGGEGQVEAMDEFQGSGGHGLGLAKFSRTLGLVDMFPMVFVGSHAVALDKDTA